MMANNGNLRCNYLVVSKKCKALELLGIIESIPNTRRNIASDYTKR